jgi:hypothetical protein
MARPFRQSYAPTVTTGVTERQHDDESLRLLRAFTHHYRRAKLHRGTRILGSAGLAVAGPIMGIVSLTAAAGVGAVASLWVLLTRLVLLPAEERHVDEGVRLQERFDTRLFNLRWPRSLAGRAPREEDIAEAANRLADDQRTQQQHAEGWYPDIDVPWPSNVLLCQWSSAAYGRRQHRAYANFLIAAITALTVGVVVFGAVTDMALTAWLLTFALPALPALLDLSELAGDHLRLGASKARLEDEHLAPVWARELARPGCITTEDCRAIQDVLYRQRSLAVQIPEWFFWRRRERAEATMHEAAAARVRNYQDACSAAAAPRQ